MIKECNSKEIYHVMGDAYFMMDKYQAAIKSYETAMTTYQANENFSLAKSFLTIPDLPDHLENTLTSMKTEDTRWSPYTKVKLGWCMFLNQNYADAITFFRQIYDPRQYDITAYTKLVLETLPKKQVSKLIKSSQRNKNSKNLANSLNAKAWLYFLEENYSHSIELFSYSLSIGESYDVFAGRGMAFYEAEQYSKACADFKRSIALKPCFEAFNGIGFSYIKTKSYDKACIAFKKALTFKNNHDVNMGYGFALLHSNILDKAMHYFKEAIEFHDSWQALKGLGQVYFQRKMYSEAMSLFDKSLALHEDHEVYKFKAEVYKVNGNFDEYRRMLDLAKCFESKILYIHSNTE